MILDTRDTFVDTFMEASADYVGDASELVAIQIEALSELHNLSMAMARVEHKCLMENDNTLMESAIGDFFTAARKRITEWWTSFIKWAGSLWTRLKEVFVKRQEWLNNHKSEITAVTNEQLKDVKVKIGNEVLKGQAATLPTEVIEEGAQFVKSAIAINSADTRTFAQKIKDSVSSRYKSYKDGKSLAAAIAELYVGKESEIQLDKTVVGNALKAAEGTFAAIDKMKGAKVIADAAIAAAKGEQLMAGGDKGLVNARLKGLTIAGTEVQQYFSAASSALATANSQAMSVLVKAASKYKAPEAEKEKPKNESAGILDAFM